MAASYFDAAEACYLNAQRLAPADIQWPYYLGHLYKAKGPLAKSVVAFETALQLRPNDVATLVWLGDAYLAQGKPDAAEPLFNQALSLEPDSAAAHFGAGRAWAVASDVQRPHLIVDDVAVGLVKVKRTEVVGIRTERLPRFSGGRPRASVRLTIRPHHVHHHEPGGRVDDVSRLTLVRGRQLTILVASLI
jgi:hypothetical protein